MSNLREAQNNHHFHFQTLRLHMLPIRRSGGPPWGRRRGFAHLKLTAKRTVTIECEALAHPQEPLLAPLWFLIGFPAFDHTILLPFILLSDAGSGRDISIIFRTMAPRSPATHTLISFVKLRLQAPTSCPLASSAKRDSSGRLLQVAISSSPGPVSTV